MSTIPYEILSRYVQNNIRNNNITMLGIPISLLISINLFINDLNALSLIAGTISIIFLIICFTGYLMIFGFIPRIQIIRDKQRVARIAS